GAAPHPSGAASADSARKTNCSDTPQDSLVCILPTTTAGSDGDAVGVAHEWFSSPVAAAAAPLWPGRVGSQTAWLPVPLRSGPRATANRSRPQPPAPNSHGPYPAPFRNYARSAAARVPTQTVTAGLPSFSAWTFSWSASCSPFVYGVSMPGDCPALLHILLFVCGKHSAPSRTPFR